MPVTRLIALNPNSGTYTPILATIPAGAVEIVEDGSVAQPQGLEAQFPGDDYASTDTYPGGQPIELGAHGDTGVLGWPQQNAANGNGAFNYRPADAYCQLRSATATATTVRVVESET